MHIVCCMFCLREIHLETTPCIHLLSVDWHVFLVMVLVVVLKPILAYSHVNTPAFRIWSLLEVGHRHIFGVWAEKKNKWSTLHIRDATSHMLQADEVHISALKEYIPCGHIHPSQPGLQNSNVAVWDIPPPPPRKECSRRMSSQVKNVYANAGYIRGCTGC